jgi:hypothetical protein
MKFCSSKRCGYGDDSDSDKDDKKGDRGMRVRTKRIVMKDNHSGSTWMAFSSSELRMANST